VVGGLGLAAAAAGLMILWRLGRGTEWIGQAPASLEIRFRYWIASVRMIAQSPWTGVGPGQFKARYETYRAAASTEQIADPHNWLLQIVTTGGIPAGVFGIILATAIFWRFARLENQSGVFGDAERRVDASAENPTTMRSDGRFFFPPKWLRAGAAAGVIAVWLAGLVIGYLPTLDAAILATLAGGMVMFLAGRRSDRLENQKNASDSQADDDWRFYRRLAGWSLVAMTIHLLAAGGVIVPGVAMPLWILAGTATAVWVDNVRIDRLSVIESSAARLRMAVAAAMATLLVAWYLTAVLPIERTNRAMASFQRAWAQRRIVEAESDLRRATAADRWNADPALQHAAILAQLAIADSQNRQRWESAWDEAEAAALRRAGDDPVVIRQLGEHRLWAFQRYGDQSQLRRAAGLYERAVGLSPSHETYAAQLAEIYRETGDGDAVELAERAAALSAAGGYYERSLPFILVLPAERIGDSVASGPVRRPASDLLAPMLSP
jgi:tetratricopeptide (TPR) repeat protein